MRRPREALLLVLAAAVGLTASVAVQLGRDGKATLEGLAPALVLVVLLFGAHAALSIRRPRADQLVLPLVACLVLLGLALSQRLAPDLATRQWVWIGASVVAMTATALWRPILRVLRDYRYTAAALGIGLVAMTLVAGRALSPGGPRLWLGAGSLVFQPSEALKLLLVVFLAGYLDDKRELLASSASRLGRLRLPPLPYLAPLGVMLGLSLLLLVAQSDLGAALLLFVIALAMLFLASGRPAYLAGGMALFVAGAWLVSQRAAIVAARVSIWKDPWSDAQGLGYQLVQSLMAIAAGGAVGTGLGQGLPTAIPAVHTDFVYAAVAEELGLAGAAALLGLYVALTVRGFRIAVTASNPYAALLAGGLTVALTAQALIIVAGVVKLVPLTGITLPLLSHGGSSMLVSALSAGLLLAVDAEGRT